MCVCVRHPDHVADPAKLSLEHERLNACNAALVQHCNVGDPVLPTDTGDGSQAAEVELLEASHMPPV